MLRTVRPHGGCSLHSSVHSSPVHTGGGAAQRNGDSTLQVFTVCYERRIPVATQRRAGEKDRRPQGAECGKKEILGCSWGRRQNQKLRREWHCACAGWRGPRHPASRGQGSPPSPGVSRRAALGPAAALRGRPRAAPAVGGPLCQQAWTGEATDSLGNPKGITGSLVPQFPYCESGRDDCFTKILWTLNQTVVPRLVSLLGSHAELQTRWSHTPGLRSLVWVGAWALAFFTTCRGYSKVQTSLGIPKLLL